MTQTARIVSAIEYREGDGPPMEIPEGPVALEIADLDVTLSWVDGDFHGSTAIPIGDYQRYLGEGKIELDKPEGTKA